MARAATSLERERRERALEHAQWQLETKLTDLKRLVTSIRFWQRRLKYYTQQVQMTDEQRMRVRTEQVLRREARAKRHRKIRL